MDEATATLVLELMKEEAATALENLKGKQAAGRLSDRELALRMWHSQLEQSALMLADYKMARSIARAIQDDGVAITIANQGEQRVSDDRRLALQLGGCNPWFPTPNLERPKPARLERP